MERWLSPLQKKEKAYRQLAADNQEATTDYNQKILLALTQMGGLLMLMPLLSLPFRPVETVAVPAYLVTSPIYFGIFLLFRRPSMRRYVLWGLYGGFSVYFLSAIYFSVVHSPHMMATLLLCGFCIMPTAFIDRPGRINLYVAFWFVAHTVLASFLKPEYVLRDAINSFGFAVLGCFLGNMMVWVRLESCEARRLLTIEKETDVLTGLQNRRKLFETLAGLEASQAERPTGILMVDIDNYKQFNDLYGHATGDRCLSYFGQVLTKFAQNFRLDFYRYGGEEFVAMAYGYSETELFSIAESLRIAVQSGSADGLTITVSIGVAYCGDEPAPNYEKVLGQADKAAYAAKHRGRNRVCTVQRDAEGH